MLYKQTTTTQRYFSFSSDIVFFYLQNVPEVDGDVDVERLARDPRPRRQVEVVAVDKDQGPEVRVSGAHKVFAVTLGAEMILEGKERKNVKGKKCEAK